MVQEHRNNHHHLQQQQRQQQLAKYGGGGGNGAATGMARSSRKNKPKKIPQRGLGVAQLEKLRIEEQRKMGGGAPTVPATATPSSHGLNDGGGLCHLPTLHHPPPPPPTLPLSALSRPAADGAVHCGFPPVLWSPVDPTKHPYKRSLCPQPPLQMVSTGLSLTASLSHPTEPPSNQMYSSSGSRSSAAAPAMTEEDRETAGVDRSWPFMFEGMTAATAFRTRSKALPPPVVPFAVRTASDSGLADVSHDLSRFDFRATNYFSAYANYSDWTSEFAHCKSNKENGRARDAAFLTLSSQPAHLIKQPHMVPSIQIPEYNDFSASASASAMPCQGSVSELSSSRPFYSFLPVGPVRCQRAPRKCKTDVSEGGVDLELKLWKG